MIPESLRALLTNLIDYAGLYPPAALPLPQVIANYRQYLESPEAWMMNRLVLPVGKLGEVALDPGWRVTLLVEGEPGPQPPQIETLETKSGQRMSLPTYCEVPLDRVQERAFAKVRTAGISTEVLADFLYAAAARRIPFKATAGLHHPIRAVEHGFLNVFAAACFAWQGMDRGHLVPLVDETDPRAFAFSGAELRWRDERVSTSQILDARRDFAHSFGSCSFEEPVNDLRSLGLLP